MKSISCFVFVAILTSKLFCIVFTSEQAVLQRNMFGQIQIEQNSNVKFQVKFNYSDDANTANVVDTITVDGAKAGDEHENLTEPSDTTAKAEMPANINVSKVKQSVEMLACI